MSTSTSISDHNTSDPNVTSTTTYAIYPLTPLDTMSEAANIGSAWIVEGLVDVAEIRRALDGVVRKWGVLSGRVELQSSCAAGEGGLTRDGDGGDGVVGDGCKRYQIRVPLHSDGALNFPEGYKSYGLTSTTSPYPLSHYGIKIRFPDATASVSDVPPMHLFVPEERLRRTQWGLADYVKNGEPLMHWHVTHFLGGYRDGVGGEREVRHEDEKVRVSLGSREGKDDEREDLGYSCIGVHWPHGIFDGVGISIVIHAFEAELNGRTWTPPPKLLPGVNENVFEGLVREALRKRGGSEGVGGGEEEGKGVPSNPEAHFSSSPSEENTSPLPFSSSIPRTHFTLVNLFVLIRFILGMMWVNFVLKTSEYTVVIPYEVHRRLVAEVRKRAEEEGLDDAKRISTGDVVIAWWIKTMYGDEKDRRIHLGNISSLRGGVEGWSEVLGMYPHNCISTIAYPLLTSHSSFSLSSVSSPLKTSTNSVSISQPLHRLAHTLTQTRLHHTTRLSELLAMWDLLREKEEGRKEGWGWPYEVLPYRRDANESVMVTNMCAGGIGWLDWGGALGGSLGGSGGEKGGLDEDELREKARRRRKRGGKTLMHYKLFPGPLKMPGILNINGKLENGDLVVSTFSTVARRRKIEEGCRVLERGVREGDLDGVVY
ncbi:hypothetical protein CC1G_06679 [Coprinopsis cinerea okayama7|uniref:Uncharacterized protein n=1 Tax=Coprinopsis cinerea (strain Okayama-7 / 130 / ATCC MYA-4618 / FGSC 9003) TaxID=240176 RepID=A8P800_COPC7|nr:hypothetical protein CC1G_06679 [Coprinopsis cinerea okayama7\|eukprot:XP_001839466.2 hypothetical protein CC1G_06679 [Coprinopsis cinerea okayama7\